MKDLGFNNDALLKVLLRRAKNSRKLTEEEIKVDSKLKGLTDTAIKEIEAVLIEKGYISTEPVFINSNDPTQKVYPFLSSDGKGLTPKGEDLLLEVIDSFNQDKKDSDKKYWMSLVKWVGGILAALIVAYIVWKLGWL